MLLHWLQQTGNKPIVLMGGGTTRVGDPSGRDESRRILTLEDIESNKQGIQQVFAKFLDMGGQSDAMMSDNAEWLAKLNYIDMLRDVGKHFSVNRMLTMDSVKLRLEREHELSFIEFNYMVWQPMIMSNSRAAMAAICKWAVPTNGETLSMALIWAAAWAPSSSMP